MIGKALSDRQMSTVRGHLCHQHALIRRQQILRHMGELRQPWNCPHGRSTMRFLHALPQHQEDVRWWTDLSGLDDL